MFYNIFSYLKERDRTVIAIVYGNNLDTKIGNYIGR